MSQTPLPTQTLPEGGPGDHGVRMIALGMLAVSACFSIAGFHAAVVALAPWLTGGL